MKYRALGKTGLIVSEIGFGCASFWGKTIFDEKEAVELVHAAAANGVTFFDTGSSYSGGNAEPRLGRALQGLSTKHDLIIASKAGTRIGSNGRLGKDFSVGGIRGSVEKSLKQLGLSSLPVLHLHGPKIADLNDALLRTLEQLKQEGKIRALSVNSFDPTVIAHVATLPLFGAVMIDYNILRPEREPLINELAAKGIGIFAGMAMAGGLYSSRIFRPKQFRDVWYLLRALKNHRPDIQRGRALRFIEKDFHENAGKIILSWVLHNPRISCAVLGTTRLPHLQENLAASGYDMPQGVMSSIADAQRTFAS